MKLFSAAARLSGAEVTLRGQSARIEIRTKQLRAQQRKGKEEKSRIQESFPLIFFFPGHGTRRSLEGE
jgi:hypothetical protein